MPINTVFELAAMAAERRPGAGGGGDAAHDPRPHALLARRQRVSRVHERDDDAVLRRPSGTWARDLLERLGFPTALLPEVVPPATALAPLGAGRRRGDGARRSHGRWRARPTTPPRQSQRSRSVAQGRRSSAREPGRLSGSSCREPVIDDRTYAANLTNEGGVGGHRARPAERHRSLAAARVPPGLGARGRRPLVRAARRPRRVRAAAALARRPQRPTASPRRTTCRGGSGSTARGPASPSPRIPGRSFAACSRALR